MNVTLPARTAIDLYAETGFNLGADLLLTNLTTTDVRLSTTEQGVVDNFIRVKPYDRKLYRAGGDAWIMSSSGGAVNVIEATSEQWGSQLPEDVIIGRRAVTVAPYIEQNSKAGAQHEGSTLLLAVAGLASNNTIFKTGALPVSLKGRIIGYTGDGVTASIYTGATYTGGTSVPYQNASDINPVAGLSEIIVGATITTEGTLAFAPDNIIGNKSNQGKGSSGSIIGRESLLKPNTVYLFRLTSLDTSAQDIASLLTWYEGDLDLPRVT